jgi:hypothetical protein
MRVGYCIAHSTFVTTMMAVKQPYNIPVCSEAAALAAVSARPEIMEQVLAIVDERNSMVAQVIESPRLLNAPSYMLQLKQFPYLQAFPSQANFVLFHVTSFPAQNLALALRSRGILVRLKVFCPALLPPSQRATRRVLSSSSRFDSSGSKAATSRSSSASALQEPVILQVSTHTLFMPCQRLICHPRTHRRSSRHHGASELFPRLA